MKKRKAADVDLLFPDPQQKPSKKKRTCKANPASPPAKPIGNRRNDISAPPALQVQWDQQNVKMINPAGKIPADKEKKMKFFDEMTKEFSTDPSFPPSSDPSSYTTYSSTTSNKSTPTFPSDRSTSNSPTPVFPEDKFPPSDDESNDSLVDFDIDPKSENVNKKRAVFQVAEVPFNTLAQMIRLYLESVIKDPSKPVWPVPDMDRNQKRNFRRKAEKFKRVNGSLRHHHIYVDEKNKVKRGMYYRDVGK